MNLKKSLVVATMFAIAAAFADGAASVESVTVPTKAPHNQEATFWYHVPASYDAKRKKPYQKLSPRHLKPHLRQKKQRHLQHLRQKKQRHQLRLKQKILPTAMSPISRTREL